MCVHARVHEGERRGQMDGSLDIILSKMFAFLIIIEQKKKKTCQLWDFDIKDKVQ